MGPVSKKNVREKDPLRVSKRRFLITCMPYYLGSSVAPLLGEGGRSLFCVQGTLQSSEEPKAKWAISAFILFTTYRILTRFHDLSYK